MRNVITKKLMYDCTIQSHELIIDRSLPVYPIMKYINIFMRVFERLEFLEGAVPERK